MLKQKLHADQGQHVIVGRGDCLNGELRKELVADAVVSAAMWRRSGVSGSSSWGVNGTRATHRAIRTNSEVIEKFGHMFSVIVDKAVCRCDR